MRYPNKMIFIHWLVAILVLLAYLTGGNPIKKGFIGEIHIAIGIIIFILFFIRAFIRLFYRKHTPKFELPKWQSYLAHIIQGFLYICMVLVPLTGLLGLAEMTTEYQLFGINLPMFSNFDLGIRKIHEALGQIFIALSGIHAAAALAHHFIWKDSVLKSMLFHK